MTSRGFNGDGGQNDVKGVIVVQGWVVRKGRMRGLITTSEIRTESDHECRSRRIMVKNACSKFCRH